MNLKELLEDHGISLISTNDPNEFKTICTNPNHIDKHPSMGINFEKNVFNCFSCGYSGKLNILLKDLNIDIVGNIIANSQEPVLNRLKQKLVRQVSPYEIKGDIITYTTSFRNISAETIKYFNIFRFISTYTDYIFTPIYQYNQLKFIEGRSLLDSREIPKYFRQPMNADLSSILFPLDHIIKLNTTKIALVEGLFDALYLIDNGIPALCNFGVAFNDAKAKVLKAHDINYVDIVFDGDRAGKNGSLSVIKVLNKHRIHYNVIELPTNKDPAGLNKEELKELFT